MQGKGELAGAAIMGTTCFILPFFFDSGLLNTIFVFGVGSVLSLGAFLWWDR